MIVQVLAFIFIISIGFTASLGRLTEGRTQLNHALARSSILTLREQVIALIGSHAAWQKTISHNPAMACMLGGDCVDGTTAAIDLYDSEDSLIVQTSNSLAGYALDGQACTSFSTSGVGTCVVRIELQWKVDCGGPPSCQIPEELMTIRFAFNGDQVKLNPMRFDVGTDPPTNNPYLIRGSLNPDTTVMRCAAKHRVYVGTSGVEAPGFSVDAGGCIALEAFLGAKGPKGYKGQDGDLGPQGATGPRGCDWDDGFCPTPFPTPTPALCIPGALPPVAVACVPTPNPGNVGGTMVCNDAGSAYDKCIPTGACAAGYVPGPSGCVVAPVTSCTPVGTPVSPQQLCPQLPAYNNFKYELLCGGGCGSTGTCVDGYTYSALPTPHCDVGPCTPGTLKNPIEYCTLTGPNPGNVRGRLACNAGGTDFDQCVPSTDCLFNYAHDPDSGGACKYAVCCYGIGRFPFIPDGTHNTGDPGCPWISEPAAGNPGVRCAYTGWPSSRVGEGVVGPYIGYDQASYPAMVFQGSMVGECKFVGGVATWDYRFNCFKSTTQCESGRTVQRSADGNNVCQFDFSTRPAATPPTGVTAANQQTVNDSYTADDGPSPIPRGVATGTCNSLGQWDYAITCPNPSGVPSCPSFGVTVPSTKPGSTKFCKFDFGPAPNSTPTMPRYNVPSVDDGGAYADGAASISCNSSGAWVVNSCCCESLPCAGSTCP